MWGYLVDRLAMLRDPQEKYLLNVTDVRLCSFAQADFARRPTVRRMIRSAPPAPLKTALLTFVIAVVVAAVVAAAPHPY